MGNLAPGATPSPNIWRFPQIYETENRGVDRDHVIEATMQCFRTWSGATVLDLGCGTGFHLPAFATEADRVIGVEPHGGLLRLAQRRTCKLATVRVLHGSAQAVPLPDSSIDVVHTRWAYFFGPGCEPGLRELDRVMRPGGVAFVIDHDATRSTLGRWFSRAHPTYDAQAVDHFFSRHGWQRLERDIRWQFDTREDFEAVVRIEFSAPQAELILAEHPGQDVDYAVLVRVRRY